MRLILPSKEKIIKTSEEDSGPERYYGNKIVRYLYLKRLDMSVEMIENERFENILDVGCGGGILEPTLRKYGKNVYGLDVHEKLREVKRNIQGDFIKADVCNMPFRNGSFDCIFCISVLEHLRDLEAALEEVKRCLTEKGRVIFGTPSNSFLVDFWFKLKKSPALVGHVNTEKEIWEDVKKRFFVERKKYLRVGPFNLYTVLKCRKAKSPNLQLP